MHEVHIYIETNSASPRVTEKKYGYVLECQMPYSGKQTREGFGQITGTYHQATLEAMGEALERINQSCEVHIHTPDEFVLNMMQNNLETWAGSGFLNSKGKPVANQEAWMQLWPLVRKHLVKPRSGKHSYSEWLQTEMRKK